MPTPSRSMPPRTRPSLAKALALYGIAGASCLALAKLLSVGAIAALASILVVAWAFGHLELNRQRTRLAGTAAERQGESICHFARSFDARVVDTWVIRAVYETCQQELEFVQAGFPLRASDKLGDLLCDPDDLDMAVAPEVSRRAGRSLVKAEANPWYGTIQTVSDLVMFFNAQPKSHGT